MTGKIYFNYMIMRLTGVNKTQQFELKSITKLTMRAQEVTHTSKLVWNNHRK